ncbi:type II secretion system GspH family protein [Akkermansiaceae bacterium]|nr:type II secretion system GspH family protein [Akkermansiaceae bacterium]
MIIFSQRSTRRKGFTLAELLVAMTITIVLVTLTITITGTAIDAWRGARTEIRAASQAKIMLDALGSDLESMILRRNNEYEWLHADSKGDDIGPEDQPSPNAGRLIFFTAAADRYNGEVGNEAVDNGGDVCAVSYQLAYTDPVFGGEDDKTSTFVMYRALLNPDETFRGLLGEVDLDEAFRSKSTGNEPVDFICENIYELTVTFVVEYIDSNDEKKTVRIPVMATTKGQNAVREFEINGTRIKANGRDSVPYKYGSVVAVDLSITVISDPGLRILKNSPFADDEAKAKFIAQNGYRYSKTVLTPQP